MITIAFIVAIFYLGLSIWLVQSDDAPIGNDSLAQKVTVIVPVKTGTEHLLSCLQSLLKNEAFLQQIIVVNDGALADIDQTAHSLANPKVSVVKNTNNGKKHAVQFGVSMASTEWVSVVDVDVVVSANWMQTMLTYVSKQTHMVLGPVFISPEGPILHQMQAIEFMGLQTATRGTANRNVPLSANGANMLFRKSTFEQLLPYNDNFSRPTGDDVFLMNAIHNQFPNGIVYASNKEAMVLTAPVQAVSAMLKQRARWASKADVVQGANQQLVGAVVVITNVFVLIVYFQMLFQGFNQYMGFVLLKWIADWAMMQHASKMSGLKIPHLAFAVSSVVYPLVVVYSLFAGIGFKKQTA